MVKHKEKSMSLHIVHTEALAGPGGQTLRVLNESKGMIRRGHSVTLLCRPDTYLYEEAQNSSITALPWLTKKFSLKSVMRLRRWLNHNNVDVINTHSSADSWITAIAQLGTSRKVPVVRTRHMKNPVGNDILSRWLYQKATQFIVTTGETVRQKLIDENKIDPNKIRSYPSGVDHIHFHPRTDSSLRTRLGLPTDKTIVGIASIFSGKKGFDDLIRAAGILKDKNLHWIIVGDVNRQSNYRQELEELTQTEGVADQFSFTGFQKDVAPWLQSMDIFCLPTTANEGIPQVIMQAMLCRLPVITTPMGSIPDAIEDMSTGLLVPPRNPTALAQSIASLVNNPNLRETIAEKGYQKALANYTQDIMLDGMEDIFLSLVRR